MKRRDVIKYVFATLLALFTLFAIGTLSYAKHRRQQRPIEEGQRIQQRLEAYGQQGSVPERRNVETQAAQ